MPGAENQLPKLHKSLEVFLRQPLPKEADRSDVEKALTLLGFTCTTPSSGSSHYTWKHSDGRRIVYALVKGRKVKAAAVASIAKEVARFDAGE